MPDDRKLINAFNRTNDHAPANTASYTLLNVMIGAIVARIYYKILTIEDIFLIGCTAICSLSLYVTVGKPFLSFSMVK